MGRIISVNVGQKTGEKKEPLTRCKLIKDSGLLNDAHAGSEIRQVSLLAMESIEKIKRKGLDVRPGDFAENLTTEGVHLYSLSIGTKLKIGRDVILEVTQIGKICNDQCHIFYAVGDCVMPREGIFARVISGGEVTIGDTIESE